VFWEDPRKEAPRWSRDSGLVFKRKGNPKEATVEAWGLIDGQPTSRHYGLLNYDDVVTQDLVGSPERIKLVTERWELSDNLGTHGSTRKWHQGTRYSFADTYGVILERGTLKARVHPATEDGTLDGEPVLLSHKRWAEVKDAQRSTVSAQMLLNPIAGNEAVFRAEWLRAYEVRPTILNVYIMVDPSKGATTRSDRTAIAVIGVDVAGNMYLLDGVRHRMTYSERYGHLKRLWLRWSQETGVQSCRVGYERYGAQTENEIIERELKREGISFSIEELNWPRQGAHSKVDRVSRLEPDMRKGRFYLPGTIFHPSIGGIGGIATWIVWTQGLEDAAKDRGEGGKHRVGQIVYRPYRGPSKAHVTCERTGQGYRIRTPIKAIDEERKVYDLTRAFIEEALFFPFAQKDDLVDAVSRIYDMEPVPPVQHESAEVDATIYPDT
jgi:phage terminase large subunit-like protein